MVWTGSNWLRIRDQWRAFVNTVMKLEVHLKLLGIS
jgi:hypothetical protein